MANEEAEKGGEQSPEEATQDFEVVTNEAVDRSEEPADEESSDDGETSDQEEQGEESAKAQQEEQDDDGEQDEEADEKDDKADNAEDAGAEQKPKKARFQKRIDRLTKRASEAERRAQEAERKLQEYNKGGKGEPKDETPVGEEPDPNDFDDYNEYLDALSDWKAGDKSDKRNDDKKGDDKKGDKDKQPDVDPDFEEALTDVQEAFEETRSKHKDFDDVVGAKDLAITSDMVKAMADSDDPGEIAYYLGKHKEDARRIAGLSSFQQAKEIGKLEARLSAQPNKQPSKKVTNAPDPIEPVGGNASSKKKDVRDMSFDEYEQTRNAQERSRGGFW